MYLLRRTNPGIRTLIPVALAVFLVWLIFDQRNRGADFAAYYAAGQMIRDGHTSELYSVPAQALYQNALHRQPWVPFCHLPIEVACLVPFTHFVYSTAYVLWCFFNLACVALSFWILRSFRENMPRVAFWAALAVPLTANVLCGQDAGLLLLIYAWAYVSLARGDDVAGGCALGLGLLHYGLTIPFLAMLAPQVRRKAIAWFAATGSFLFAASSLIAGRTFIPDYLAVLRYQALQKDPTYLTLMPSVLGLVGSPQHPVAYLLIALALLGWGTWAISQERRKAISTAFAIGIPVALAADPHGFTYGWVLLAIPALILEGDRIAHLILYTVPVVLLFCAGVLNRPALAAILLLFLAAYPCWLAGYFTEPCDAPENSFACGCAGRPCQVERSCVSGNCRYD